MSRRRVSAWTKLERLKSGGLGRAETATKAPKPKKGLPAVLVGAHAAGKVRVLKPKLWGKKQGKPSPHRRLPASFRNFVALAELPSIGRVMRGGGPLNWSIYALCDAGGRVRYVGATSIRLERRLEWHLSDPVNVLMESWIASERPTIHLITRTSANHWQAEERKWIAWFRERGLLLNVDPGGLCRDADGNWIGEQPDRRQRRPTQTDMDRAEVAAKSGPVRSLTRAEIEQLYPRHRRT